MDTGDIVSGDELWERICSGLAAQTRDGNETKSPVESCQLDSFSEIFNPTPAKVPDMDSVSSNKDQASVNPWTPMADSQQYLAALENRLRKLKGLNEEPSSKEMLLSLSQTKKECWDRFLHEQYGSDVYSNGYEMDQSAIDHFKRWLQPERVPVSAEEVQYLINLEGQPASQEELESESCSACEQ
ncbi:coiled-coil domain-containing protein 32 [Carcharodon carcharias]|uniref:coiled-coil domain-containing protein 32 n=1 Tax=Carcharodon carcharias TaxID=13397 RepID=UPI001B7E6D32|nr:coiled-coil domain-containing protein 32 [Carcharodon carcharias]